MLIPLGVAPFKMGCFMSNTCQQLDLFGATVAVRELEAKVFCLIEQSPKLALKKAVKNSKLEQCTLFSLPSLPKITWSDEDIEGLRESLIYQSLAQLSTKRSAEEMKQDIMDWVHSDDMHPFSFIVCCKAIGLDYETLREGVINIVAQEARQTI